MSGASTESDTAAWRELLPWATPEERRTLLNSEHLAARFAERLTFLGVRQVEAFEQPAALEALASLFAEHHSDPMRLIDGESVRLRPA